MAGELWIVNPRRKGVARKNVKQKRHIPAKAGISGGEKMAKRKSLRGRKRDARGRLLPVRRASSGSRSKRAASSSSRRRPYVPVGRAHRAKRVVRNPRGGGPLAMIGLGDVNLVDMAGGAGVGIASRMLPSFLQRYVKLPTEGFAGYGVQLGAGLGLCMLIEKFLKMRGLAKMGRLAVLFNVTTRLADDLIFKGETFGSLAGLGLPYPPDAYAKAPLLEYEQMLGGEYPWDTPDAYLQGQFTPGPVVEKYKSAY